MAQSLDPEVAALVAQARSVVSKTHKLTRELDATVVDLEQFAASRDRLAAEKRGEDR